MATRGTSAAQARANHDEAIRRTARGCLIAADVDRTVVEQGDTKERSEFLTLVAPKLVVAAQNGMNLAFLTGNSMKELSERFLKWLVQQLCLTGHLSLLSQFHFFCNSGGVYAHFSPADMEAVIQASLKGEPDPDLIYTSLTFDGPAGRAIKPQFLDATYIQQCQIPAAELDEVTAILAEAATRYHAGICTKRGGLERSYDLSFIQDKDSGEFIRPTPEARPVQYGVPNELNQAVVQVTLKPILSFRHAWEAQRAKLVANGDERISLAKKIQQELDRRGFDHFIARPGGRSSIDVTLEKLDKAYALQFIIDRLNVQGSWRLGEKIGTNTIYFGDEVIVGGGNDYPVTRIPGLLVFAVNPDRNLVPFLSRVFVPSTILGGPSATAEVLEDLNRCSTELQLQFKPDRPTRNAVEDLKIRLFSRRIKQKIDQLEPSTEHSVRDWQALHALVTLMCRDDEASKEWLSILVEELDRIMTHLATQKTPSQRAIGASHADRL
jgi:hydroxymethylpyrimidine pyrophosphatase-like HAD family hydrolase